MARASNKVISGDYDGKYISCFSNSAYIIIKLGHNLDLDNHSVANIIPLDDDSQISLASAATRGLIGELLLGPIGLVAAATAKRHGTHIVGIEFKDGKRSVVEIDDKIYKALITACF